MKLICIDTETTGVKLDTADVLEIGLVYYDTSIHRTLQDVVNAPKLTIFIHRAELNGCNVEALVLNADLIKEIAEIASSVSPGAAEFRKVKPTLINDENNHQKWITDPEGVVFVMAMWLLNQGAVELTNYGVKKFQNPQNLAAQLPNMSIDDLKFYLKGATFAGKNISSFDLPILRNNIPNFDLIKIKHRSIDPSILYTSISDPMIPDLKTCMDRLGFNKPTAHRAVDDSIDIAILIYFGLKASVYRTYLAVDYKTLEIKDTLFSTNPDSDEINEFKELHKDKLVAHELQLHALAVKGRLATFQTESNILFPKPLFEENVDLMINASDVAKYKNIFDVIFENLLDINLEIKQVEYLHPNFIHLVVTDRTVVFELNDISKFNLDEFKKYCEKKYAEQEKEKA